MLRGYYPLVILLLDVKLWGSNVGGSNVGGGGGGRGTASHPQPWTDIHNTCAALKQYFRRLAEPLIPAHLYPLFMDAAQLSVSHYSNHSNHDNLAIVTIVTAVRML